MLETLEYLKHETNVWFEIPGRIPLQTLKSSMAELLVARDYLQAEGECVRRINTNYAYLAHTASASVKVIAESIGRWRTCEQGTIVGPVMPPALSPSEGEKRAG